MPQPALFSGRVDWAHMTPDQARQWLDRWRQSRLDSKRFCAREGISLALFRRTCSRLCPHDWKLTSKAVTYRTTPYERGYAFERRTAAFLEKHGFTVYRSLGSRSPVDLVAMKSLGDALYVQCKRNGVLSPFEWNVFLDFVHTRGLPIVAVMPERGGVQLFRLLARKGEPGQRSRELMTEFVIAHE